MKKTETRRLRIIYSTMYTRHKDLELLGRDSSKNKTTYYSEYAHAMGNGPGGLKEYWENFSKVSKASRRVYLGMDRSWFEKD